MTVEKHFIWEWKELAGKSCLHVVPHEMVDDRRWVAFFEEIEGAFPDGEASILIDIRHIEDRISVEGLKGIWRVL